MPPPPPLPSAVDIVPGTRHRVALDRWSTGAALALVGLIVVTGWVATHRDTADPLVPSGPASQRWLLQLSGLASSLGSGPVRAAMLAVGVAALLARRRWVLAGYVVTVTTLAHFAERVAKAVTARPRPSGVERGYALDSSVNLAVIVALLATGAVILLRRNGPQAAALIVGAYVGAIAFYRLAGFIPLSSGSDAYPSGHATNTMAVIATLALVRPPGRRWNVLALVGALFVVVVGISRVTLGFHQPFDVLGGWLLGLSLAFAGRALLSDGLLQCEHEHHQGGHPQIQQPNGAGADDGDRSDCCAGTEARRNGVGVGVDCACEHCGHGCVSPRSAVSCDGKG